MAELPYVSKLLQFPSPSINIRFSLALNFNHSSFTYFSPLRRRHCRRGLSFLPTLSSPPNSPDLLLISTSVQSDGSLVFKFGDESEIPPIIDDVDGLDTMSNDAETEVKLETQKDNNNLVVNDQVIHSVSKSENDVVDDVEVKDSRIEFPKTNSENDVSDMLSDNVEIDVELETEGDQNLALDDHTYVSKLENDDEDSPIELPKTNIKNDVSDILSDNVEIEVELETESDQNLALDDHTSVSKLENDDEDSLIELPKSTIKNDVSDMLSDNVEIEVELETESDQNLDLNDHTSDSALENDDEDAIEAKVSGIEVVKIEEMANESASGSIKMKDSSVEDSKLVALTESGFDAIDDDESVKEGISERGLDVGKLECEVTLEGDAIDDEESVKEVIIESDFDVENVETEVASEDKEFEEESVKGEIINGDVDEVTKQVINHQDLAVALEIQDSVVEDPKFDMITESGREVGNFDIDVALENVDEVVEEVMDLPVVQFEADLILDAEVDDAGLPGIVGPEDSSSGDHGDAAFPIVEPSTITSTETIAQRAEISSNDGDISTLPLSISSASASLSHPSKANDTVPLAILQADDSTGSRVISEPADPGSDSSGTATSEANLDSVQIATVGISVPSAIASVSQPIEVNDALVQQSDGDLCSDIDTAANQRPGIFSTAEMNDSPCIPTKEEFPEISLSLVSAAASLANSTEVLSGGDDAYFICKNWFGVADGVGQWSFGGIDKGLYAQKFIQNCESLARKSPSTGLSSCKELLQQSAAITRSPGAARVLIAHISDQVLNVAYIGDSGFLIIRNGTVFKKSCPMFHEFNFPYAITSGVHPTEALGEYCVELEEGDIIVTATDGLFDNLYEREIASIVYKAVEDGKDIKDIAELLAGKAQEVGRSPYARTPFADAAHEAGHTEFSGGKFDHVTVIVSLLQKE